MSVVTLFLALAATQLPEPFATPWNRAIPAIVDRPAEAVLSVPPGFEVDVFAEGLANPRKLAQAPNGDVFVSVSRSGEVVVLRDTDGDGTVDLRHTFASGLERP